jgi:hypothetical protein
MGKKFGISFSPKRALGISAAKSKISKATGIPLTKQGRQRKIGKATGCCIPIIILISFLVLFAKISFAVIFE